MADSESVTVHPGDIVQTQNGHIYLVSECHGWGIGTLQRWAHGGEDFEVYYRFKPGQFTVVGTAAFLPKEVAERRKASLRTAEGKS